MSRNYLDSVSVCLWTVSERTGYPTNQIAFCSIHFSRKEFTKTEFQFGQLLTSSITKVVFKYRGGRIIKFQSTKCRHFWELHATFPKRLPTIIPIYNNTVLLFMLCISFAILFLTQNSKLIASRFDSIPFILYIHGISRQSMARHRQDSFIPHWTTTYYVL